MSANHQRPNGVVRPNTNGASPVSEDEQRHHDFKTQCADHLAELYLLQRLAESMFNTNPDYRIVHVPNMPLDLSHSAEFQFTELELHLRSCLDDVQRLAATPEQSEHSPGHYEKICDVVRGLLDVLRARVPWELGNNRSQGHAPWPLLMDRIESMSENLPPYSLVEQLGGKSLEMCLPLWTIHDEQPSFYFADLADFTRCVSATMAATPGRFDAVVLEIVDRLLRTQIELQEKAEDLTGHTRREARPNSLPRVFHSKLTIDAYTTLRNAIWQATYMVAARSIPDISIPETLRSLVEANATVFNHLCDEFFASGDLSQDSSEDVRDAYTTLSVAGKEQRAEFRALMELRKHYLPPPVEETAHSDNGAGGARLRSLQMVYAFNYTNELGRINELLYQMPLLLGTQAYEIEMRDIHDNPVALVWRLNSISQPAGVVRNPWANATSDAAQPTQLVFNERYYVTDDDGAWFLCCCRPQDEVSRLEVERQQGVVFGAVRRVCTCLQNESWLEDDPGQLRIDVPRGGAVIVYLSPSHVRHGRRRLGLDSGVQA